MIPTIRNGAAGSAAAGPSPAAAAAALGRRAQRPLRMAKANEGLREPRTRRLRRRRRGVDEVRRRACAPASRPACWASADLRRDPPGSGWPCAPGCGAPGGELALSLERGDLGTRVGYPVVDRARVHRHEQRDADREADLAAHVHDARPEPQLLALDRAHRADHDRRERRADARAEHRERTRRPSRSQGSAGASSEPHHRHRRRGPARRTTRGETGPTPARPAGQTSSAITGTGVTASAAFSSE